MENKDYPLYEVEPLCDLKELTDFAAARYGDKPAFVYARDAENFSISFQRFKSDTEILGTALFGSGARGRKLALLGENSYEWILTYFAVVNSGNVIVPLDMQLPAADIKSLVDHSGAEVFVYSESFEGVAAYLKENNTAIRCINMNDLHGLAENEKAQTGGKTDNTNTDNTIGGNTNTIESGNIIINNEALMAILYTSGTTGAAKGVMLSHKNFIKNTLGTCQNMFFPDSGLMVLPLSHVAGFIALLCMIYYGTTVAITGSLKELQNDLVKRKPRITLFVPMLISNLYKQIVKGSERTGETIQGFAKKVLGDELTFIINGGAPLDEKYVRLYSDLGITIMDVYGLTETSPVVSANRNHYYRGGSVGRVIPTCEVKISDPDPDGQGEIFVKGDTVMLGYYGNEQATRDAFDGEWFKTGDIGYLDEDGFLFISGRKKNVIVLGNGKNVYPEELEFALAGSIPYIREVVVYAEENVIVAEMLLDTENEPGCASRLDGDILAFNKAQATYKNIGKTIVRDTEFPKTAAKKIKRHADGGKTNA